MIEYNKYAVARTIRRLRLERGQSQEMLSSFAGIARSHLSMIENATKQPNFETLWKIANAFNMEPHVLIALIEEETLLLEK